MVLQQMFTQKIGGANNPRRPDETENQPPQGYFADLPLYAQDPAYFTSQAQNPYPRSDIGGLPIIYEQDPAYFTSATQNPYPQSNIDMAP